MRRLRDRRLLAAALGLALGTANPASVLADALAHHRDHEAHWHVRLHQATGTPTQQLLRCPPVTATSADLNLATPKRVGVVPVTAVLNPDPPGDDPPRLRAPPLITPAMK